MNKATITWTCANPKCGFENLRYNVDVSPYNSRTITTCDHCEKLHVVAVKFLPFVTVAEVGEEHEVPQE